MFYFRNDISQISVFTVESVDDPETPTICHIVDGVVARLVQPAVDPSHPRTVSHLVFGTVRVAVAILVVTQLMLVVVRVVVRVVVVLGVVLVVGLTSCQPVAPVGEPGQGGVLGVREAQQTAGQTEAETSSHQEY